MNNNNNNNNNNNDLEIEFVDFIKNDNNNNDDNRNTNTFLYDEEAPLLPHLRCDCLIYTFKKENKLAFCENCYCWFCNIESSKCQHWINHCEYNFADKSRKTFFQKEKEKFLALKNGIPQNTKSVKSSKKKIKHNDNNNNKTILSFFGNKNNTNSSPTERTEIMTTTTTTTITSSSSSSSSSTTTTATTSSTSTSTLSTTDLLISSNLQNIDSNVHEDNVLKSNVSNKKKKRKATMM